MAVECFVGRNVLLQSCDVAEERVVVAADRRQTSRLGAIGMAKASDISRRMP